MATNELGRRGEEVAARHLQAAGWRLVDRNWRAALGDVRGELDLVAWDGTTLVFCEVKTRRSRATGGPLAAVTSRKQTQLRRLAALWLVETGVRAAHVRFDVIGVSWPDDGEPALVHVQGVC